MDKRGIQHVEIILAFVIFLTFLIFAFYFFSPLGGESRVLDSSLFYAESEITEAASVKLESYSVSLERTGGVLSIEIENPNGYKTRVEDYEGNKLEAKYESGRVVFDSNGADFINVKFSEIFTETDPGQGTLLTNEEYTISSSDTRDILSEKKFEEIKDRYDSDYLGIKEDFNLPNRIDFAFSVVFDSGESITAEREIPEGINVISESSRIEIFRSDGKISFADLIIKIY